ncbi:hypothetical protein PV326_009408 [Microctonus aethiopoides]|nr:hypothetical protein PV326_009408 [Microctonus aethiopoides]
MVKYCVVGSINSKEKRKEQKELKLQKNSLFTVPKNIQIIRQWSEILRQNWDFDPKCNKYICDEHFDENHIIRKDIITIPGQQPFTSDRKKIILKRDAIPTLNKDNSASRNAIGSIAENIFESVAVASEKYTVNEEPVNLMNEDGNMEPNIMEEVEYRNAELLESPSNFSIYDLMKHLEMHKLPKKWSWTDDHLDAPAVILCHLDHQLHNIKFRVKFDKSSQMCSGSGFDCQKYVL